MLRTIMLLIAVLGWGWSTAVGQTLPQEPTLYQLSTQSSYLEGCLDGLCLCPVLLTDEISGSFVLVPDGQDGTYATFLIQDLRWVVSRPTGSLTVMGGGRYRVDPQAELQRLELELSLGGGSIQQFDSNLVPLTSQPPGISLGLTRNQPCYDIGFQLDADPEAIIPAVSATWGTWKSRFR